MWIKLLCLDSDGDALNSMLLGSCSRMERALWTRTAGLLSTATESTPSNFPFASPGAAGNNATRTLHFCAEPSPHHHPRSALKAHYSLWHRGTQTKSRLPFLWTSVSCLLLTIRRVSFLSIGEFTDRRRNKIDPITPTLPTCREKRVCSVHQCE